MVGRRALAEGGLSFVNQPRISAEQQLLIAVVAVALEDCDAVRRKLSHGLPVPEWDPLLTRGRKAWQWLTDPELQARITFIECCQHTGADYDVAMDAIYARWPEAVQEVLDKPIVQPPKKTGAKRGVDSNIQRKKIRGRRRSGPGHD